MHNAHERGASIECQHGEVVSRKIIFKGIFDSPKVGRHTKYTCDRNSKAKIVKVLSPKLAKNNPKSLLNLNDSIEGDGLFFLTLGLKAMSPQVIGGYTGTHKAQLMETKDYTYAELTKPFEFILNAIHKRRNALPQAK